MFRAIKKRLNLAKLGGQIINSGELHLMCWKLDKSTMTTKTTTTTAATMKQVG